MERCLQLAALGAGHVAPNPMVGAVLVHDNKIIGEGYHRQYGQVHAEVNCLNSIADADKVLISKSTLYVSLEPCSHYGKTPPCADLIVKYQIPKVVIACKDDYAEVNGKGIEKLLANGIEVITGILEKEAIELNKRFFTFHNFKRPYIILKWTQSNDGIIGRESERVYISGEGTNKLVHKWRSEEAAILVGTNTALKDDPALSVRLWQGRNPLRIVIDNELKLPTNLQLFDQKTKTIVFNKINDEEGEMLSFYRVNNIKEILDKLYQLKLQSLIVEGGAKLLQSFIDADLWDEARVITNNSLSLEKGIAAPLLKNAVLQAKDQLLSDSIGYYKHEG